VHVRGEGGEAKLWFKPAAGVGFCDGIDAPRADVNFARGSDASALAMQPLLMATDPDPAVRLQGVTALAEGSDASISQRAARAELEASLADPDAHARGQALQALANDGGTAAAVYQLRRFRYPDPDVTKMMA